MIKAILSGVSVAKAISILAVTLVTFGFVTAQKGGTKEPVSRQPVLLAPAPIFNLGSGNCAKFNGSGNDIWQHITEDWELRLASTTPPQGPSGPYPYVNGIGPNGVVRFLPPGSPQDHTKSVSIVRNGESFDWSSDFPVALVIVQGRHNVHLYRYALYSRGGGLDGIGLVTPLDEDGLIEPLTRISFCYDGEPRLIPSAAPVSLSGKVIGTNGRGLSGAQVTITNAATGEVRSARSNVFGYYIFDELEIGQLYQVGVMHKRYQFSDNLRTITLSDNLEGLDFVASN